MLKIKTNVLIHATNKQTNIMNYRFLLLQRNILWIQKQGGPESPNESAETTFYQSAEMGGGIDLIPGLVLVPHDC